MFLNRNYTKLHFLFANPCSVSISTMPLFVYLWDASAKTLSGNDSLLMNRELSRLEFVLFADLLVSILALSLLESGENKSICIH